MCTAIAKKGNDLIYGFNLDMDPTVWNYALYKTKQYFSVGITVGSTTYMTHGVTKDGCFSNVPYMNGENFKAPRGAQRERIDLMTDRYLRGKYSYEDLLQILQTKTVVNIPAATMHSLVGDGRGRLLIVEPGYGFQNVAEDFAVLTNFPVLAKQQDYANPFYGKDRYDKAFGTLQKSGKDFSAEDALNLLWSCRQEGQWATRISFVYSQNENAVFYFLNGDRTKTEIYRFKAEGEPACRRGLKNI